MANRRQLVKRRNTVRNIRKITRTMQLIATARFQKALSRAVATRPYADKLTHMVRAASGASKGKKQPLLQANEGDKSALIVITSNRGLCGGYNGNVLREALRDTHARREAGHTAELHAMGKKGINYLTFLGEQLASQSSEIDDQPRFEQVVALADQLMAAYVAGEMASVSVCYMRFISAGVQKPTVIQLLPITQDEDPQGVSPQGKKSQGESDAAHAAPHLSGDVRYDYTPAAEELLDELLPASVRMRLFGCFTDAAVSEQVARMIAMKAATDAAGDMIKLLTQQYNRARQTAITMELLDIIGGVAAIS